MGCDPVEVAQVWFQNIPQQPSDEPTGLASHCSVVLGGDFGLVNIGSTHKNSH